MRTIWIILLTITGAVVATAGPVLPQAHRLQGDAAQANVSVAADHKSLLTNSGPALSASGQARPSQSATNSGMLRTVPHGAYECALPGDAGGRAYEVVPEQSFRISTASRYEDMAGQGTYILRANRLTFTAGPRNGDRFLRVGENQLRKLDANGKPGELLCTRLADRRQ